MLYRINFPQDFSFQRVWPIVQIVMQIYGKKKTRRKVFAWTFSECFVSVHRSTIFVVRYLGGIQGSTRRGA